MWKVYHGKGFTKFRGVLESINKGIEVFADTGFAVRGVYHCLWNRAQSFKEHDKQLDPIGVASSRRIASTRIRVERTIGWTTNYQILNNIASSHMLPKLNKIAFYF